MLSKKNVAGCHLAFIVNIEYFWLYMLFLFYFSGYLSLWLGDNSDIKIQGTTGTVSPFTQKKQIWNCHHEEHCVCKRRKNPFPNSKLQCECLKSKCGKIELWTQSYVCFCPKFKLHTCWCRLHNYSLKCSELWNNKYFQPMDYKYRCCAICDAS